MKTGLATYAALLILIFQSTGLKMDAQPVSDSILLNSPIYKEKLHLYTDRSLYAAGEQIQFSLHNLSHPLLKENGWSSVVYLELISFHQIPVAQGKYLLSSHGSEGNLLIPDSVSTGSYHLRVYTKWMRNFEPSEYFYLSLYIVNPRNIEKQEEREELSSSLSAGASYGSSGDLRCSPERGRYGKREKVGLKVHLDKKAFPAESYCVSVTKKGYLDENYSFPLHQQREKQLYTGDLLFLPETRGCYLSGVVSLDKDSTPVALIPVHITLLGPDSDYFGAVTDPAGRVQIPIPSQTDAAELLITYGARDGEELDLVLQDEFSKDLGLAPPAYTNEFVPTKQLIQEMRVFSEVSKPFVSEMEEDKIIEKNGIKHAFYGSPEFRYFTSDYIEIPNLEEFIFELIPQVQVERQNRQRYLSIIDDAGPISEYAPLILVDFVPITQMEAILSLTPDQIEYIDVVNAIYIRGSNNYGGIINIVSKNGDLAGLPLPEGSSLFSFQPIHNSEVLSKQTINPQEISKRIPDLRTTLYWNARFKVEPESQSNIEFFTSDVSGTFMAVIRGIGKEGELIQVSCEFKVQ